MVEVADQERKEGFYWIKFQEDDDWEVGHLTELGWYVTGFEFPYADKDISIIGERIKTPEN